MNEYIDMPNLDGGFTRYPAGIFKFQQPPRNRWRCRVGYMTYLHVPQAPNWFHRQMQRLAFGYVWERLPIDPKKAGDQ